MGFSLTYSVLRFPNIAHAAFITVGAYVGYTFSTSLQLGFEAGLVVASVATGILGAASYYAVFRPLSRRTPGLIASTITSVGYGLAITYIVQQLWGRNQLFFSTAFSSFGVWSFYTNWLQVSSIILTLTLALVLHLFLSKTKLGAAMRATSSNPDLVRASGIRVERIVLLIWFLGSALAGIAGIVLGAETALTPAVGSNMLVTIIAVAIFGGIGSYYGVLLASFVISLAENLSVPALIALGQPAYYNLIVAYVVVIIAMLFFPQGLAGSSQRLTKLLKKGGHG